MDRASYLSSLSPLNDSISPTLDAKKAKPEEESITESELFASMEGDQLLSAVSERADADGRAMAAAIALEWASNDTNSFDDLEALIAGAIADVDDDEESEIEPDDLNDEDAEDFNNLFNVVGQAISLFSGMPAKSVQKFIDEEDDNLAPDIIKAIMEKAKGESSDELVADFALREAMLLSAKVKVVRDGKIAYINKKVRKRKMSAKQRMALKKARKKAHNSAARAKRKKSARLRKRNGM